MGGIIREGILDDDYEGNAWIFKGCCSSAYIPTKYYTNNQFFRLGIGLFPFISHLLFSPLKFVWIYELMSEGSKSMSIAIVVGDFHVVRYRLSK
jgi:hypothetical protein